MGLLVRGTAEKIGWSISHAIALFTRLPGVQMGVLSPYFTWPTIAAHPFQALEPPPSRFKENQRRVPTEIVPMRSVDIRLRE